MQTFDQWWDSEGFKLESNRGSHYTQKLAEAAWNAAVDALKRDIAWAYEMSKRETRESTI